ncbi:uncharacterized protein LOC127104546 [Lathyrus oleraceus]|uniref:uncharacterized protein LOC127104546 n=1 Tax=Pisum sativum TaxID=3888 RepID=UPI0021D2EFF5|nr:uncharacterized protein LOC127104546 [Pisum sativum]
MSYAKLYSSLIVKNLVQPRSLPPMPEPLPWWYKPNQHYAYHQGEPGHDIENSYPLKYEVQHLVISGMMSFEDRAPNVKSDPLPAYCNSSVNMVDGCPVPYEYDKVVPYKYDATMIKDGQKVPLSATYLVVRIADIFTVTRSGRVFIPVFPKAVENIVVRKKAEVVVPLYDPVNTPIGQSGESSGLKNKDDNDEVLHVIKKGEFNVVEPLLQTPSKIFVLSLLMNSEAHREALQKFDHIVANITACNNLAFCDEELPEEGKNHNLALHISMNCKEDALSNILVDTGSSLNVLPKSTLARLSYQEALMRYNGVIVKAFGGSHKTVIGEVDLPIKIDPSNFQITFQTLKFIKNGKLVIIGGEKSLLVSHLSSFMYVEAEEVVGTPFYALSIDNMIQRTGASMSSLKYAQEIVQDGDTDNWGRVMEVVENKNRAGSSFEQRPFKKEVKAMQQSFHNGGFIHKE